MTLARDQGSAAGGSMALAVGALFFLSGVAALVYQVAWQRLLALLSGASGYSVAMIVAAFMGGIGIGSHWGGRKSARITPREALRMFACLELGLAAFACFSPLLYYDLLHLRLGHLYGSRLVAGVLHVLALLPPTALMGMSLPFLARATVAEVAGASRTIGFLYAINTAGAALGALLAPWLLIRFLGVSGAIWTGAVCNLAAGLGAFALLRRAAAPEVRRTSAGEAMAALGAAPAPPFRLFLILYALSGFCALSLEILWFRLIDVAVKSSAFTFGTVLAIYLGGLATGGFAGTALVHRVGRPLRAFLLCQCALLLYAGLAVLLLVRLPVGTPLYSWFVDYWAGSHGTFLLGLEWQARDLALLYGVLPAALFGPPTFLMGFAYPILQKAVQDDPRTSGERVGELQAANIVGCVAGSLAVGLASLGALGSSGTLRALVSCGVVFAFTGVRSFGFRPFALWAVALSATALALPGPGGFWMRLHGTRDASFLVGEDGTGISAFVGEGRGSWKMLVNGHDHSWVPYRGVHSILGAAPVLAHPAPRHVAVIGLGSGDTAWAAGCRRETRSVSVFEIVGPQAGLVRALDRKGTPWELRAFLSDPRVTIRIEDGRHALSQDKRRYDAIEMDALEPYRAMSGNIYSREFFELCESRLAPGGVFCAWTPTARIRRSIEAAFPHVIYVKALGQPLALASNAPLLVDTDAWRARLESPPVASYLGPRITRVLLSFLETAAVPPEPLGPGDLNTDLFPRDEFSSPE